MGNGKRGPANGFLNVILKWMPAFREGKQMTYDGQEKVFWDSQVA